MTCRPSLVWGVVLAAGVAAEAHALACNHHDCTLSALTREVFRTSHPAGRIAFMLGTAALAVWFQYHIVTWKRELEAPPVRAKSYRSGALERGNKRSKTPSQIAPTGGNLGA